MPEEETLGPWKKIGQRKIERLGPLGVSCAIHFIGPREAWVLVTSSSRPTATRKSFDPYNHSPFSALKLANLYFNELNADYAAEPCADRSSRSLYVATRDEVIKMIPGSVFTQIAASPEPSGAMSSKEGLYLVEPEGGESAALNSTSLAHIGLEGHAVKTLGDGTVLMTLSGAVGVIRACFEYNGALFLARVYEEKGAQAQDIDKEEASTERAMAMPYGEDLYLVDRYDGEKNVTLNSVSLAHIGLEGRAVKTLGDGTVLMTLSGAMDVIRAGLEYEGGHFSVRAYEEEGSQAQDIDKEEVASKPVTRPLFLIAESARALTLKYRGAISCEIKTSEMRQGSFHRYIISAPLIQYSYCLFTIFHGKDSSIPGNVATYPVTELESAFSIDSPEDLIAYLDRVSKHAESIIRPLLVKISGAKKEGDWDCAWAIVREMGSQKSTWSMFWQRLTLGVNRRLGLSGGPNEIEGHGIWRIVCPDDIFAAKEW